LRHLHPPCLFLQLAFGRACSLRQFRRLPLQPFNLRHRRRVGTFAIFPRSTRFIVFVTVSATVTTIVITAVITAVATPTVYGVSHTVETAHFQRMHQLILHAR